MKPGKFQTESLLESLRTSSPHTQLLAVKILQMGQNFTEAVTRMEAVAVDFDDADRRKVEEIALGVYVTTCLGLAHGMFVLRGETLDPEAFGKFCEMCAREGQAIMLDETKA